MFVIKSYGWWGIDYFFCRTLEGAKKTFFQVLEDWKKEHGEDYSPRDFSDTATTWEEFWDEMWENREWDDIVACEPIEWEEDEIGD